MADNSFLRDALDAHESLHDFAETDKSFAESVDFLEAVEAKRRRRADSKHSAKIAAVADAQHPTKTVAGAWHVAQLRRAAIIDPWLDPCCTWQVQQGQTLRSQ